MEDSALIFGQRVFLRRKALGWTQRELATRAGPRVTLSAISRIERGIGQNPTQETELAIARALGVRMHQLWGSDGEILSLFPGVLPEILRVAGRLSVRQQEALLRFLLSLVT